MVRLKAILIAGVIAVPALLQAADFDWYGSYKQSVYFVTDLPDSGEKKTYSTFQADNCNTWVGISNIGANIKGDKYAGQVELRIGNPKADQKVYLNQAWGSVDFTDKLGLTIGITGTPFWVASAFQGYAGEIDQLVYGGRRGHNDNVMLYQLNINSSGPVSGKFALIHNEGTTSPIDKDLSTSKDGDEIGSSKAFGSVPQMQASASYKSDVFNANLVGAFQTYSLKYKTDETQSYDTLEGVSVPSWAFGFDVGLKFGKISILGGFAYGQNTQNMGIPTGGKVAQPHYNDDAAATVTPDCSALLLEGEIKSSMMWGAPFSISFNFTDNASLTVGYGISNVKLDIEDAEAVSQSCFFTNAKFKKSCFTFIPEIGFNNYDDMAPNQLYYGLFTQVDL